MASLRIPPKLTESVIAVIGALGSDGGYTVVTPHGLIHVPGNRPVMALASIAACAALLPDEAMRTAIGNIVYQPLHSALASDLGKRAAVG